MQFLVHKLSLSGPMYFPRDLADSSRAHVQISELLMCKTGYFLIHQFQHVLVLKIMLLT